MEILPPHGLLVGPHAPGATGRKTGTQVLFTIPVNLNGKRVWAQIDTGCGRTLIRMATGTYMPEVLTIKCVHGNVKEYQTKDITLDGGGGGSLQFKCRMGVVPQLDCPVLIGRYCPLFPLLLGTSH